MKVENLRSSNGNRVANQFVIQDDHGNKFFQSYNSVIIKWSKGKVYLDEYYWDYSRTTGKYRNQLLREGIAETRKKIESGEYILADLN